MSFNPFSPSTRSEYDKLPISQDILPADLSPDEIFFFDFGDIVDDSPTLMLDFGEIANPQFEGLLDLGVLSDATPPTVLVDFGNINDPLPIANHVMDLGQIV